MKRLFCGAAMAALATSAAWADWRVPTVDAHRIAHDAIIVDGHVDIPYRLQRSGEDIAHLTKSGDFDYPRAVAGGLNAPFMAIYVAADFQADAKGGAKEQADALIDLVRGIADAAPGKFAVATSVREVEAITRSGRIALPMGMENGAPIGDDVDNVDYFYERGVRYIGLAHSRANKLSDSSYDINRPHGGISPLGEAVVRRMNDLGVIVDVSHVSDDAFWDIMNTTRVPVMASHSSARKFTPGFERNMDDDMIRKMGETKSVIMVNFGSSFLTEGYQKWTNDYRVAYGKYLQDNGLEASDEIEAGFSASYQAEFGAKPFANVDDVLDHIDHIVALAGIDSVGIGSDYDGVGDSLPVGLKDASYMPNLVQGLMDRGYSERDIRKILSGNALRMWRAVEKGAIGK